MNTQIYEEATNWLIKHREADLEPQQKQAFDAWLRASPQHVRAYLEMSAIWEDVPALDPNWNPTPDVLIARAHDEDNIYSLGDMARATIREPRLHRGEPPEPGAAGSAASLRSWRRASLPLTLAATLLIGIVGITAGYWLNRNTYTTDTGEQRSIILADGSTVELNSRSRIRVRYSASQRDVDLLEGQALFRVSHNTARPFIVHSGAADVRAVGTQFDVYRKRAGIVVTVVEGKVAVLAGKDSSGNTAGSDVSDSPVPPSAESRRRSAPSAGNAAIFLSAGEQLTVPASRQSHVTAPTATDGPQHANLSAATAWTHRTLVFDSSPLTDVAEEFNRYNTRQLIITDPQLADIHISGMFSSVDPALLLKFLRTQPELNVEETETEIRISKR